MKNPVYHFLTPVEMEKALRELTLKITHYAQQNGLVRVYLYGVPRGGVPVAYAVASRITYAEIVITPEQADIIIDDLLDSGATREQYKHRFPDKAFKVLFNKELHEKYSGKWLVFPWETIQTSSNIVDDTIVGTLKNRLTAANAPFRANDNIHRFLGSGDMTALEAELTCRAQHFLDALVIDTENDANFKSTAKRLAKMYLREVYAGRYTQRPDLTAFPNTNKLDELYTVGPITVRSACSHHLVPVTGKCWIGIVPGGQLIGLSKFHRIVDWLARRPQMQEELVVQIADELERVCQPLGLAVVLEANHTCVTWRGVKDSTDSVMVSSVVRGVLKEDAAARAEFLSLINRK